MLDLTELFRLHTPVAEIVIRGSVIYLALFAMMRIIGKRESGALSLPDLLVVVLVAESASHGLASEAGGLLDSLLLVAVILLWSVALDALAWRWKPLARLLKSSPAPLIRDGRVDARAMRRELLSDDELTAQLRLHGVTDVRQVARAYLEPNGMISVIRAAEDREDDSNQDAPGRSPAAG